MNDSWYWRYEKLGNYSVKSSYLIMQNMANESNTASNSRFWRKLWNLKIPNKVKHFLWRALSNCLPTKVLLLTKRVQVNASCAMCNDSHESIMHILVLCPFAVDNWTRSNVLCISGEFSTFMEWLQLVFQKQQSDDILAVTMICWMIWKSRNELIWNQHSLSYSEIVESALSVLNQWRIVQDRTFDPFMGYMSQDDGEEHWSLPLFNSVKVNSYADLFEESNCFSYAYVFRDHTCMLVEARSRCIQGNPSPEMAKAISIREALSWVRNSDYHVAMVESDCLQVVQAIRSSFHVLFIPWKSD